MKIIGKRIELRPFEQKDAKYLQEIRQDVEGLKSYAGNPFPSNLESEQEWIARMYSFGNVSNVFLGVFDRESDEFVGYCLARNINLVNRNADVGIILHKNARGKGYFKDTSRTFYGYLFEQINLHKLYSFVLTTNHVAFETDLKIGFENEGLIKEHIFQDGVYKDVYFVSLYKDKFKSSMNN